jgi:hypothetical protein
MTTPEKSAIVVETGGKPGIGKALALKIASFPFIDCVLGLFRSITDQDVIESRMIQALAADIGTAEGRGPQDNCGASGSNL